MTRNTIHAMLDEGALHSSAGSIIQRLLMTVTVISAFAVIGIADNIQPPSILAAAWIIEIMALVIFMLEFATRLWAAPEDLRYRGFSEITARLHHALSVQGLLDLAVIGLMIGHLIGGDGAALCAALSLIRLIKIVRYSVVLNGIMETLASSGASFAACIAILLSIGFFAGGLIFLTERTTQPEIFGKLSTSIWWGISTLIDSDYSDTAPQTAFGNLLAASLGLFGFMIVALPMGILGAAFQSGSISVSSSLLGVWSRGFHSFAALKPSRLQRLSSA
jgi:voltage-gated potassium channel